ncbi:MAG: divalent cation tolerance protein CutA [Deltaproteobacteria bacterium]|nr:divalent cation tolerance protein CutA [Deltaproteobacteria bacterium]
MAACVQIIGPIRSIYRRKGNIERDEGWLCHIKGRRDLLEKSRIERAVGSLNPDLWEELLNLCDRHVVRVVWVWGHSCHPENEHCDALAVEAAKGKNLPIDEGDETQVKCCVPGIPSNPRFTFTCFYKYTDYHLHRFGYYNHYRSCTISDHNNRSYLHRRFRLRSSYSCISGTYGQDPPTTGYCYSTRYMIRRHQPDMTFFDQSHYEDAYHRYSSYLEP